MVPNYIQSAKRAAKSAKQQLISSICNELDNVKEANNGTIKHGVITKLIAAYSSAAPHMKISRHDIRNMIIKRSNSKVLVVTPPPSPPPVNESESTAIVVTPPPTTTPAINSLIVLDTCARMNGGRPIGSTKEKLVNSEVSIVAAKNEIATLYAEERDKAKRQKMRVKRGLLSKITTQVRKKRSLPEDCVISPRAILRRVDRKRVVVLNKNGSGQVSPLLEIEPEFVKVMIQMARIGEPLTPTRALLLINDLIAGTKYVNILMEWKRKHTNARSEEALGKVGYKYWLNFKKRNADKIVSKKGEKFELDRSIWTTYHNFKQMYDRFSDEMEYAKVAVKLDTPVWMNKDGETVEEKDSFGCKVTHMILRSDMMLCGDEVGADTSQKGDGAIGGEKFVCATGTTPKEKCSTKSKHWTLLPITCFDGSPVMCVVIFAGLRNVPLHATGMDQFADVEGNAAEEDFFDKNSGPGKLYPGGPTCLFKGVEVPCMCRWTPKGSIDGSILLDILRTIDLLGVYKAEREEGLKPMLLLDAHGSRFDLDLLTYVNTPATEWCLCIGVPYGTSLWQVGDSSQQNGSYKMATASFKRILLKKKLEQSMSPHIFPHEIMLIINYAWNKSFTRVDKNKTAVCERGWFPYNRNLLTDPSLRFSMTDSDRENETSSSTVIVPYHVLHPLVDVTDVTVPTFDPVYLSQESKPAVQLNYSSGISAWCLDTMVSSADRTSATQRNIVKYQEGQSLQEKMNGWKKPTGGKVFSCGEVRLGVDVLNKVKENKDNLLAKEKDKKEVEQIAYVKMVDDAKELKQKMVTENKTVKDLSNIQLKTLLKPWKQTGDPPIPTLKKLLIERYESWKGRTYTPSSETEVAAVDNAEDGGNDSGEEEEFAFEMV